MHDIECGFNMLLLFDAEPRFFFLCTNLIHVLKLRISTRSASHKSGVQRVLFSYRNLLIEYAVTNLFVDTYCFFFHFTWLFFSRSIGRLVVPNWLRVHCTIAVVVVFEIGIDIATDNKIIHYIVSVFSKIKWSALNDCIPFEKWSQNRMLIRGT